MVDCESPDCMEGPLETCHFLKLSPSYLQIQSLGVQVDWGKKEKDYDPNEEFPGTKPFRCVFVSGKVADGKVDWIAPILHCPLPSLSEPESQIILGLAKALKPHVWLNIHSGMEAMFVPWDHKAEVRRPWIFVASAWGRGGDDDRTEALHPHW